MLSRTSRGYGCFFGCRFGNIVKVEIKSSGTLRDNHESLPIWMPGRIVIAIFALCDLTHMAAINIHHVDIVESIACERGLYWEIIQCGERRCVIKDVTIGEVARTTLL